MGKISLLEAEVGRRESEATKNVFLLTDIWLYAN
jgi:hypothetical protein